MGSKQHPNLNDAVGLDVRHVLEVSLVQPLQGGPPLLLLKERQAISKLTVISHILKYKLTIRQRRKDKVICRCCFAPKKQVIQLFYIDKSTGQQVTQFIPCVACQSAGRRASSGGQAAAGSRSVAWAGAEDQWVFCFV